jgi:hypothetical protein
MPTSSIHTEISVHCCHGGEFANFIVRTCICEAFPLECWFFLLMVIFGRKICKGSISLLKALLYLMDFNPNFTYYKHKKLKTGLNGLD